MRIIWIKVDTDIFQNYSTVYIYEEWSKEEKNTLYL